MEKLRPVTLDDLERSTFEEDDSPELPPNDIVAYNESRACADIFRMWKSGALDISPSFQREYVWKPASRTRFIDSLTKQLPIPSMCFSYDYKVEKWQVIDGLQRIHTIISFLNADDWKLSKLDDIDPDLAGQDVRDFNENNPNLFKYYSRIENLTLPITVLRCDLSKDAHAEYVFSIFHRLNSEGMKLNNQEIRNCIFSGPFNEFLHELNRRPLWMRINKMKNWKGYRFTKEELLLRFFAFHDRLPTYNGRLSKFLNKYMKDNRFPDENFLNQKNDIFERTTRLLHDTMFEGKIPSFSITILEALLVGISGNLQELSHQTSQELRQRFDNLLEAPEYREENLLQGLARKQKVIDRLSRAKQIFSM